MTKDEFFVPENANLAGREEHPSPSGRYKLVLTPYGTTPGSWSYTQGLVYDGEKLLCELRHNYHNMAFAWIEGHADGQDYLMAQEDYQGQSLVQLATGITLNHLPLAAKKGHGFCWASISYNVQQRMLVVDGCIWACPYETRFYDFSLPMSGWPEIGEGLYIDAEGKSPTFAEDGTITCYETRERGAIDGTDYASDDYSEEAVVVATKTFRRDGLKLELVSSWVEEAEQKRRADREEGQRRWQDAWEKFKSTDPLFLRMMERIVSDKFDNTEYSLSTGVCHDRWHPTEKFDDARVCKRIAARKAINGSRNVTMEIEFGRQIAPIKLTVHRDNGKGVDYWFERSLKGMDEALDMAKAEL